MKLILGGFYEFTDIDNTEYEGRLFEINNGSLSFDLVDGSDVEKSYDEIIKMELIEH